MDVGDGSEAWLLKGTFWKVYVICMYMTAYNYVLIWMLAMEVRRSFLRVLLLRYVSCICIDLRINMCCVDVGVTSEAWLLKGIVVKVFVIYMQISVYRCLLMWMTAMPVRCGFSKANMSCPIFTSHVPYSRVMSHMNMGHISFRENGT